MTKAGKITLKITCEDGWEYSMTTDTINALYEEYGDGTAGIMICRVCGLEADTWEAVKHGHNCTAPEIYKEITALREENKRLDKLSRAQTMQIKTMSEDEDAYRHFECATIINTTKAKADAVADAAAEILKARDDINLALMVDTEQNLEGALQAYRGEK